VYRETVGPARQLRAGVDGDRGYNKAMPWDELITRDPTICGGEPVFRGTRVTLRTVLACLADGDSVEQIIESFPTLQPEQVRAAIAFAAASVQDDLPLPELPTIG
jgi:uncharacterized protein (DUF433 family)